MKRYWFDLLTENYDLLSAFIPDGSNKKAAVNRAKRWMKRTVSVTRFLPLTA